MLPYKTPPPKACCQKKRHPLAGGWLHYLQSFIQPRYRVQSQQYGYDSFCGGKPPFADGFVGCGTLALSSRIEAQCLRAGSSLNFGSPEKGSRQAYFIAACQIHDIEAGFASDCLLAIRLGVVSQPGLQFFRKGVSLNKSNNTRVPFLNFCPWPLPGERFHASSYDHDLVWSYSAPNPVP